MVGSGLQGAMFAVRFASIRLNMQIQGARANAAESKLNVVLILADDLGWTDLGCQGSKYYETPNIDRLASQGMRLLRYYNSQNCAPTRAVLMSGQYAPRTGIYTVNTLERGEAVDRRMNVPANESKLPLDRFRPGAIGAGEHGEIRIGEAGA